MLLCSPRRPTPHSSQVGRLNATVLTKTPHAPPPQVGRLNATVLTLQEDIALMASNISDLRSEVDDLQPRHHLHRPPPPHAPPPPPLASTVPLEGRSAPPPRRSAPPTQLASTVPLEGTALPMASPSALPVEQRADDLEERARRLEVSAALALSALADHAARLACLEANVTEQSGRWIEPNLDDGDRQLDDGGPL